MSAQVRLGPHLLTVSGGRWSSETWPGMAEEYNFIFPRDILGEAAEWAMGAAPIDEALARKAVSTFGGEVVVTGPVPSVPNLPDSLADMPADSHFLIDPERLGDVPEISIPRTWVARSVAVTLDMYRSMIEELVERVAQYKTSDVRYAVRTMRELLRGMAAQVYVEAMREAGIEDAESMLTPEDVATIDAWLDTQYPHVSAFITAARMEGMTGDILNRIGLWTASLAALGNIARGNAQRALPVTWHYGDTMHCTTCAWLNGKRHRLSWFLDRGYIPRQPGSAALECGGWNCQCSLVADDGSVIM